MEQLTKQERTSINRYLGFSHTSINLLINFDPKIYESLSNTGWLLPENSKDIERNIEDFVNIYSAMYKESRNRITPSFLVRGTSNKRAQELNGSAKQFLSTSTDESIAKTFTEYGDGALVYFSVDTVLLFNPIDTIRTQVTEFARVMGTGFNAGVDVAKRTSNFNHWFIYFAIAFALFYLLANHFIKIQSDLLLTIFYFI